MLVILYAQKLAMAKERRDDTAAEACAEAAIALIEKKGENTAVDFLTDNHKKLLVSSNLNTPELIRQLLAQSGTENAFVLSSTRIK